MYQNTMDYAIQQAASMTWQVNAQNTMPIQQNFQKFQTMPNTTQLTQNPYSNQINSHQLNSGQLNSNQLNSNQMNHQFSQFHRQISPAQLSDGSTGQISPDQFSSQITNKFYPEPQQLDLSRPLADQRPVLKRSRLRRDFMPDRDRIDYSHVSDNKERRRLRSQDNARLYRDREKQKIMDLESSIEFLMQNNSRLTIQNTTLKYKFEVLKAHIEKARENKFQPFASKRQAFDDSTQIREDGLDNTQQSLRIAESSMDRTMDTTAEVGFNQYSRDRIGFNDHSEICAVVDATEKPENKKTGEVEPTSFNYEWQNSGEGDKRCNVGKKRNHKNLSLLINDSNKTASSTSSQQTVVDALLQNNRTGTSDLTAPDTGIEAHIGKPVHTSSKIMFDPNQKTPSCYGSAEPSPADEILQKPELIGQGIGGFSMQQQLQQVQAYQQAQEVQQANQVQEVQNTHFTF